MKAALILLLTVNSVLCGGNENQTDDVLQLAKKAGFVAQAHQVETEDGYLLKVHRLLPQQGFTTKPPVFLMHGMLAASADYLVTGPKIALAYYLSENGYDVWLGNARGNKHSTNHKTLSTESREFWKFSWNEIGFYDLPAMIDHVLMTTQTPRLFYVGHSQGTTALLVLLSSRPEYNQKIIQAHLFAPAAFMKHIPHPLAQTLIAEVRNNFFGDYRWVSIGAVLEFGNQVTRFLCTERQKATLALCQSIIFAIVGPNRHGIELDTKILKTLTQHISPRISVRQLTHYAQSISSGKFRRFDYKWGNLAVYNSTTPPDYELANIVAPVYIYCAPEDALVSVKDAEHLRNSLPNVAKFRIIRNWNHVDFTYGRNTRKVLYKDVLQSFESASSNSSSKNFV